MTEDEETKDQEMLWRSGTRMLEFKMLVTKGNGYLRL